MASKKTSRRNAAQKKKVKKRILQAGGDRKPEVRRKQILRLKKEAGGKAAG